MTRGLLARSELPSGRGRLTGAALETASVGVAGEVLTFSGSVLVVGVAGVTSVAGVTGVTGVDSVEGVAGEEGVAGVEVAAGRAGTGFSGSDFGIVSTFSTVSTFCTTSVFCVACSVFTSTASVLVTVVVVVAAGAGSGVTSIVVGEVTTEGVSEDAGSDFTGTKADGCGVTRVGVSEGAVVGVC